MIRNGTRRFKAYKENSDRRIDKRCKRQKNTDRSLKTTSRINNHKLIVPEVPAIKNLI
jgi:hypothetical protein